MNDEEETKWFVTNGECGEIIDYVDFKRDAWVITDRSTNPAVIEEFYELIEKFIRLVSIHQIALDNHIRIESGMITKTDKTELSGLSKENYEEMKKIVERLKELKKGM